MKRIDNRLTQIESLLGINEAPLDQIQFIKLLKVITTPELNELKELSISNKSLYKIEKDRLTAKYKSRIENYCLSEEELKRIQNLLQQRMKES